MSDHRLDLFVHVGQGSTTDADLINALTKLTQGVAQMSAELDALKSQVQQNNHVTQSAITLIQGLAQQIKDNVNDPAALTDLANQLQQQDTALGAAVSANTPAAPAAGADTIGGAAATDQPQPSA